MELMKKRGKSPLTLIQKKSSQEKYQLNQVQEFKIRGYSFRMRFCKVYDKLGNTLYHVT